MVNVQEWLDREYPNKEKVEKIAFNEGKEIYLKKETDLELDGELVVADYPNLKTLYIVRTRLTNLKIVNCPQLEQLICCGNQLTSLDCSQFNQLFSIVCHKNLLTNIKLPNNTTKLRKLWLYENNFNQDLSIFSKFTKLKELNIDDNNFYGSLKPLKDLEILDLLSICHTNIDSGLEYLPESTRRFFCDCWCSTFYSQCENPEAKIEIIKAQLVPYNGSYQTWRKDNQELIMKVRITGLTREQELVELNSILAKQLLKAQTDLQNKETELVNLRKQLETKIEVPPK
ncbi:MAG: hypothetical protein I3270_01610 [Candidatus Moeniiplasma glomeromycotorum]|nr:hypothetical protein [Candidatus Moeniiplasma glomeromycotorum]MCE8162403.1 hypothetical protein [Candidatus Moeniiplasma glomeromycotorum]MCE8166329.1 hypothetical protein [Candidatus Moeniiplasma glomeromycotorum]MCE8166811.1 hypothetical protein [Candidatus Moeniiplasma glomeromycotorum]